MYASAGFSATFISQRVFTKSTAASVPLVSIRAEGKVLMQAFDKGQLASTQLTLGPYGVQIWSRPHPRSSANLVTPPPPFFPVLINDERMGTMLVSIRDKREGLPGFDPR